MSSLHKSDSGPACISKLVASSNLVYSNEKSSLEMSSFMEVPCG